MTTLYWVLVNKLIAPFAAADPVFVGNMFIHIFFCESDGALDEVSVFSEVPGKQNTKDTSAAQCTPATVHHSIFNTIILS